jgi:hypothetical protein
MLYLKETNYEDIEKEYEFITQLPENENGFVNPDYGCTFEEFKDNILHYNRYCKIQVDIYGIFVVIYHSLRLVRCLNTFLNTFSEAKFSKLLSSMVLEFIVGSIPVAGI